MEYPSLVWILEAHHKDQKVFMCAFLRREYAIMVWEKAKLTKPQFQWTMYHVPFVDLNSTPQPALADVAQLSETDPSTHWRLVPWPT
jgi:hypothetical protein